MNPTDSIRHSSGTTGVDMMICPTTNGTNSVNTGQNRFPIFGSSCQMFDLETSFSVELHCML